MILENYKVKIISSDGKIVIEDFDLREFETDIDHFRRFSRAFNILRKVLEK